MFPRLLVFAVLALATIGLKADELAVAREALRDGLWSVARVHAARSADADARFVVFESYAREGRWDRLLADVGAPVEGEEDEVRYFRALALVETGQREKAKAIVAVEPSDPDWARQFLRLKARLALDEGNVREAVGCFEAANANRTPTSEDSLALADLKSAAGDSSGAAALWRSVVVDTNATDAAYAKAALGLDELPLLTNAFSRTPGVELTRRVGLRIGVRRLATKETFAEGERLIRRFVNDAPDSNDARASFVALGEAYLANGEYNTAAGVIREAFEIWPDSVKSSRLQEDLGWALAGKGAYEEAYDIFVRVEALAKNEADGKSKVEGEARELVERSATAAAKQGDLLDQLGRTDEAIATYRKVLVDYPDSSIAKRVAKTVHIRELERSARTRYADFDFVGAQSDFAAIAKADPDRAARMAFLEVLCLYGRGLDDEAEKRASALVADGKDAETSAKALLWLAKLSYNRGNWTQADRLFSRYADAHVDAPDAPEALLWASRAALASGEWLQAVSNVTRLVERYAESPLRVKGYLVQARALSELARYDETVLVVDRVLAFEDVSAEDRQQAGIIRADARFALGADNPQRYQEALSGYRELRLEPGLSPSRRLGLSFKIAKTLEKLRQADEALDVYYTDVILAYRSGRLAGETFDDDARAAFSRAALRVADEFESRGRNGQAVQVLKLLATGDVPASEEARRRIVRIESKGGIL